MMAVPRMVFQELDAVKVKGKNEPVSIYAPLGERELLNTGTLESLAQWEGMLKAFRAQQWQQAEGILTSLTNTAVINPTLRNLYEGRIQHFENNPPPENWDGVTQFETK